MVKWKSVSRLDAYARCDNSCAPVTGSAPPRLLNVAAYDRAEDHLSQRTTSGAIGAYLATPSAPLAAAPRPPPFDAGDLVQALPAGAYA